MSWTRWVSWEAVGAVALPNVIGFLSTLGSDQSKRNTWLKELKTPRWKPPNIVFPFMWTFLYCCMGYASFLVYRDGDGFRGAAMYPLAMYAVQLVLNFAWTPIFFGKRSLLGGLITILLLDMAVVATAILFFITTLLAGILLVPYLVWLAIATALNYRIWRDNPNS